MIITAVKLKNWRNFREADVSLAPVSYVLGPNASGKSNLLDLFRFLRDVCKPTGGGLQAAVRARGGMARLRCLHARKPPEVSVEVSLTDRQGRQDIQWRYHLAFNVEGKGGQRLLVTSEAVWKNGESLLSRPDGDDKQDTQLCTETHLEQIRANAAFRPIAEFFASVTYLHLVPQLLKYGDKIGGNRLEDDPFGQGLLERIARCPEKIRNSRLTKMQAALAVAVPQLKELRYQPDVLGHPHLEARYEHHRPKAGWQSEDNFSDGTLRLLGLVWSLLDGNGMLLLEEPELSLHEEIVRQIPALIATVLRQSKPRRPILISTHSAALLSNPGIDANGILILKPAHEGTTIRTPDETERHGLKAGLSVADVILPKTRPAAPEQLSLALS